MRSEESDNEMSSLVPRPLPDFISQLWRKVGRRPGIKTTSRTENYAKLRHGLEMVPVRDVVLRSFDPRPSPDFSAQLRDKIWEWPGDEAKR